MDTIPGVYFKPFYRFTILYVIRSGVLDYDLTVLAQPNAMYSTVAKSADYSEMIPFEFPEDRYSLDEFCNMAYFQWG